MAEHSVAFAEVFNSFLQVLLDGYAQEGYQFGTQAGRRRQRVSKTTPELGVGPGEGNARLTRASCRHSERRASCQRDNATYAEVLPRWKGLEEELEAAGSLQLQGPAEAASDLQHDGEERASTSGEEAPAELQPNLFAREYLREWSGAKLRNLADSPGGLPGSFFSSTLLLLQCCALVHPRFRRGTYLSTEEKDAAVETLWRFCWRQWKREHPAEVEAEAPAQQAAAQPVLQPVKKKQQLSLPRQSLRKRWAEYGGGEAEPAPPRTSYQKDLVKKEVVKFVSLAPPSQEAMAGGPLRWWREQGAAEYPWMESGARLLLSFGSGNAGLERVYARAGRLTGDKRRAGQDMGRNMVLGFNGGRLGMAGYTASGGQQGSTGVAVGEDDEEEDDADEVLQLLDL